MRYRRFALCVALTTLLAVLFYGDCHMETLQKNEHIITAYGTSPEQDLELFLPHGKTKTGLIVCIHGGAWICGNRDMYSEKIADCCERLGFAAAAIDYRFLSETVCMSDILDDITAALVRIQAIANENGIALTGLLLTGHSAGGHLAELYAYKCADVSPIPPKAVVAEAGVANLTDKKLVLENSLDTPEAMARILSHACGQAFTPDTMDTAIAALEPISPIAVVNRDSVPTVLCHGQKDTVVPYAQSQQLYQKLQALGVPCEFVPYPNSNHGLHKDPDAAQTAQKLFEQYAKTYLD